MKNKKFPFITWLGTLSMWQVIGGFFVIMFLLIALTNWLTKGTPAPIEMYNVEEAATDSVEIDTVIRS